LAALGYAEVSHVRSPVLAGEVADLQARVDAVRAVIAGNVGEDVPFSIYVLAVPGLVDADGEPLHGDATPERDGRPIWSGSPDRCRLRLNADAVVAENTIAHEVFHCFQFHLAGDVARVLGVNGWIVEGSAMWAGIRVGGLTPSMKEAFDQWVGFTTSLFSIDYAAVGFFWVIESLGADPWTVVGPMLRTGGGEASVAATGLDPAEVLRRTATSVARRSMGPALGVSDRWDFSAADVPEGGMRIDETVSPGSPLERTFFQPAFSRLHPGAIQIEGGMIVEVLATSDVGALEFLGSAAHTWEGSFHRQFCLEEGRCSCDFEGEDEMEVVDRTLVIGLGERDGGTLGFTIRVIDPDDAFTDGRWEGTITATPMGISVEEVTARRDEFTAPFEVTVVDGRVVDGSYTIVAYGRAEGPQGAAEGTGRIPGTFTGCGYAPQMVDGPSEWVITVYTPDGPITVPLTLPAEGPMFPTVWVFDPDPAPGTRTGRIDVSQAVDWMAAVPVNPTGTVVTFEATRVGDP
jgi:hypothetical protein